VLGKGHSDGLGEQSRDGDALALDLLVQGVELVGGDGAETW